MSYDGRLADEQDCLGERSLSAARLTAATRLYLFFALFVLEPIVRVILVGFTVLAAVAAIASPFLAAGHHLSFWGMAAASLGAAALLLAYYAALWRLAS